MAGIKEEFHSFLDDLDKNIKNKEDLIYVRGRTTSFMNAVLDYVDYILKYKEDKINAMEKIQSELAKKMNSIEEDIAEIQQDMYIEDMDELSLDELEQMQQLSNYNEQEDSEYDTEIVCPYCESEFLVDLSQELTEVQCPECKNIIELDWTGNLEDDNNQQPCNGGHCSQCKGCIEKEDDDDM